MRLCDERTPNVTFKPHLQKTCWRRKSSNSGNKDNRMPGPDARDAVKGRQGEEVEAKALAMALMRHQMPCVCRSE
jgi:hypothetical protein